MLRLATLAALGGLALIGRAPAGADVDPLAPDRDLLTLLPRRSLVVATAPRPDGLLRGLAEDPQLALLSGLGEEDGVAELRAGLAQLEPLLGAPPADALAELAGGGAAAAFHLRGLTPAYVVALRAPDPAAGRARLAALLAAVAEKAGYPGAFDQPVERVQGAELWQVGDGFHLAFREGVTLASNDSGSLRESLDLAADADARGWLEREDAGAALAARPADARLWAFVDVGVARALVERGQGEAGRGLRQLAAAASQPGVHALVGSGLARLGTAESWTLAFRDGAAGPELALAAAGLAPSPLAPSAPPAALPIADGPGLSALLHRDLATLLREREALFEPTALPVVAQKLGELQLLVGGLDIERELLPHVSPWLQVVAREVRFEHGPRPDLRLPAAALVVRLEAPERVGETLLAGFQNLVAFTNVERAQNNERPRVLRLRRLGELDLTTAHLPAPQEGEGVDLGYNLAPGCALVGDALVVATHEDLLRELCTEIAAARSANTEIAAAPPAERVRVRGGDFAELVRSQAEAIAWRAVLVDGLEEAEARRRADGLAQLLAGLAELELTCAYPSATAVELSIAVALREPALEAAR